MSDRKPNILVTGTPGTGKTTTCMLLAEATGMKHINVGDLVKEKKLYESWDEEYQCFVINEDLLLDELEEQMAKGNTIVDHHCCEFFPERWFDLVVVLQVDNEILYDRLTSRGYAGKKLEDNIECEIMQVVLEEAMESYKPEIVKSFQNNSIEEIDQVVESVKKWLESRS